MEAISHKGFVKFLQSISSMKPLKLQHLAQDFLCTKKGAACNGCAWFFKFLFQSDSQGL